MRQHFVIFSILLILLFGIAIAIPAHNTQAMQTIEKAGDMQVSVITAPPKDLNYWNTRNIPIPTHYIFGYGSLVNSQSRATFLGHNNFAIPARISSEFGYVRKWNFHSITRMTALGLERASNSKQTINGVVYAVNVEDMSIWDNREVGYKRVEVPWRLVQPAGWQGLPKEGKLWIYVPDGVGRIGEPQYDHPIVQSYVDVCVLGFLEYGEEFAKEFLESTNGWSEWWLNDRLIERRPWVYLREHGTIDRLLANYPSKDNAFQKRQYVAFESRRDDQLCRNTTMSKR